MTDADVSCYTSMYGDVKGDGRMHWMETGADEGRQRRCAHELSDYEAQHYLWRYPDLQHKYGKTGKYALLEAKQHWVDFGYKEKRNVTKPTWETPWMCESEPGEDELCWCNQGTMYIGLRDDPITGAPLDTFDKLRTWKTATR